MTYKHPSSLVGWQLVNAANATTARNAIAALGVDSYDTGTIGIRTKSSATHGTGFVFGTHSSFGFSGTGSPPEIAGAFGIYQRFGAATPNQPIYKTTQGGYAVTMYYGPTIDDVMECFSAITILSNTGTGYTQNQRVAGLECGVQVFGANRIQPDGIQENYASGCGSKITINDTGFIDRAYAYRAAWDVSSTGTCREWAAFYQATSPNSSATGEKYGLYAIDPVVSETQLKLGKSSLSGNFIANRTGHSDSAKSFLSLALPTQADAGGASCTGIRLIAAADHSGKSLQQWEKSGESTPYLRVGSTGLLQSRTSIAVVDSTYSTNLVSISSSGIELGDGKVIQLGHSSDTTLSRLGPGKMAVEGREVSTRTIQTVTTTTTLGANGDYVVFIGASGVATLPTAVGNTGKYTLKNIHSSDKIISTTSSQTIDGSTTLTILPGDSVDVISDGSSWRIV